MIDYNGPDWEATSVTWTGWDGSVWDLTSNGVVTLGTGARGFGFAESDMFINVSPALDGGRYVGNRLKPREIFLPLIISGDDGSSEFYRQHRAFMRTMRRDIEGTLAVATTDTLRTITARFTDDGKTVYDNDPGAQGVQVYGLYLQAVRPWWSGATINAAWLPPVTPQDVYNAPGGDVFITQGKDTANATVTNNGDFPSYPLWLVDGYTPAAQVGVNGDAVAIPFPVATGQCLIINTDPRSLSATMYDVPYASRSIPPLSRVMGVDLINPVSMTKQLGVVDFAPIPPGTDIPMTLNVMGQGLISVSYTEQFEMAF